MDVNKRMWKENFTRKNAIGDHDIINTATPEKMMIIKDKYYYPNNSILVICGDVNPQEAFADAKRIFGDWKPSDFDPHQRYPIPEFQPVEKTDHNIVVSSIAQTPYIMMQWMGPDYRKDSAGTLAADVFSAVLGLNSSKWQQALIDKGLASYAGVGYQTCKYVGPITITIVPNPGKMRECYEEALKQIAMWGDPGYFSEEQLQTAKDNQLRNKIRNEEKPSTLSMSMTFWWASTSLDYFTDYNANMQKVSSEDIRNYVKKYVVGKPFIAGMIINDEMNKALKPAEYFKN
jgi:zinc protease